MADKSDKWHHTMCRYLGLNQDTFFDFGILPGVCREALGRNDYLYTKTGTFNSNKVYTWSDYHHKRLVEQSRGVVPYYGTAPFLCCLLYTSPSPRDRQKSRMPSSA